MSVNRLYYTLEERIKIFKCILNIFINHSLTGYLPIEADARWYLWFRRRDKSSKLSLSWRRK